MEDYVGFIKMFAGTQAPRGWAFCQGQIMQINTNQALFAILGTTYGGDGRTTFALPNLQGAAPIGWGVSPTLGSTNFGQKGGSENLPITVANLPAHTHTLSGNVSMPCNSDEANSPEPNGRFPGLTEQNAYALPSTATGSMAISGTVSCGNAGTGMPADKHMPYAVINYIICLTGYYPSRN